MAENPDNLFPPPDEADDSPLHIDTRYEPDHLPMQQPPIEGTPADPGAMAIEVPLRPTPWQVTTPRTQDILGTGDAWSGVVVSSYDAEKDNEFGQKGVIVVRRAGPRWDDADTLHMGEIPPVQSQPQPSYYKALPFPARDQEAYRAGEDEPVIVVTGKDGRLYYLPDDKPFVGQVDQTAQDISDEKESNFGGAGAFQSIKVRRVLMTGDPTADGYTFSAEKTTVYYDFVRVLTPAGTHHGHRKESYVLCFRRGQYIYALPDRGIYHGEVVTAGPNGEGNFSTHHYWMSLKVYGISYSAASANEWDWGGADTGLFIVDAAHLSEKEADTHKLATGTEAVVTLFADPDQEPYWVFGQGAPASTTLCFHGTRDPIPAAGKSLPASQAAGNISGDPTDSMNKYPWVRGWMFEDEAGKLNPWFCINIAKGVKDYDDSIFCIDQTMPGTSATGVTHYATGHMYLDDAGKLNPWIGFTVPTYYDPSTHLCVASLPTEGYTELTDSQSLKYFIKGSMYLEGSGKYNPFIKFSLPDEVYKTKVSSNDTADYLAAQIEGDGTWIQATNNGLKVTLSHLGPGAQTHSISSTAGDVKVEIGLDAYHHIVSVTVTRPTPP